MNFTKAQNIVFKALCTNDRVHKFQPDDNHVCVTPDGMICFIFPVEIINFNVEKIRDMKHIPITEIVKPENRLTITDDLKLADFERRMCRRFKVNGRSVFIDQKFLECFQNAKFYQDRDHDLTPVIVTEDLSAARKDIPVGIVCPTRFYNLEGYYADEKEGETHEDLSEQN